MMNTKYFWPIAPLLLLVACSVHAQVRMEKAVISMAGGRTSSATTMMDYTVGQAAASRAAGPQTRGEFGFWHSAQAASSVAQESGAGSIDNITVAPNPLGSEGTVGIRLTQASNVEVALYDNRGSLVRTLFLGNREAGTFSIPIDASDIASGTYFVAVSVPGALIEKPITVVR